MESTTLPLLSRKDESKAAFHINSDNDSVTSSGYDSAGNPSLPEYYWSDTNYDDTDSEDDDVSVFDEDDDNESQYDLDDLDSELMYENPEPVMNTIEYILSMPSLCDVIFIVGKDKTEMRGLKAILASRNRNFYKMLIEEENNQKEREEEIRNKKKKFSIFKKKSDKEMEKLTIKIEHYNSDVFDKILTFLHLGQVCVTPETVVGLMCAAEEYDVPELQKACWDFSFRCLDNGNVATIVKSSRLYQGRLAADQLISKLYDIAQGKITSV